MAEHNHKLLIMTMRQATSIWVDSCCDAADFLAHVLLSSNCCIHSIINRKRAAGVNLTGIVNQHIG
jgi:hypothetical protein